MKRKNRYLSLITVMNTVGILDKVKNIVPAAEKNLATGEETIFLDETKLAQGHTYFVLGDWEFSHDNRYLAYTVDTAGDERYELRIFGYSHRPIPNGCLTKCARAVFI